MPLFLATTPWHGTGIVSDCYAAVVAPKSRTTSQRLGNQGSSPTSERALISEYRILMKVNSGGMHCHLTTTFRQVGVEFITGYNVRSILADDTRHVNSVAAIRRPVLPAASQDLFRLYTKAPIRPCPSQPWESTLHMHISDAGAAYLFTNLIRQQYLVYSASST